MLSQEEWSITYFTENLNETKKKYSSCNKEFYAIVHTLKKWHHYLVPKDFILLIDNHALQFISTQLKLNQRHAKWVEFFQKFTFVIKHTSGSSNKVANSLTRINLILQVFQFHVLGYDELKEMYKYDIDFKESYVPCENLVNVNSTPWSSYMIKKGLLFMDSKFCIPRWSTRDNLIKEKHNGGLIESLELKIFFSITFFLFWLGMWANVKILVERCRIC